MSRWVLNDSNQQSCMDTCRSNGLLCIPSDFARVHNEKMTDKDSSAEVINDLVDILKQQDRSWFEDESAAASCNFDTCNPESGLPRPQVKTTCDKCQFSPNHLDSDDTEICDKVTQGKQRRACWCLCLSQHHVPWCSARTHSRERARVVGGAASGGEGARA